ncbi:hypothetical protein [Nannocystis radixulma]|uniref:Uncharacterized protein n=1 Tax=Nannocystis radixulma TaxID=2995305 RepID=A0ABT5B8C8_9BACT|nr:hypothetical protein [Nannocystis radixulma]MDC0670370.1 hypothetical protein [Nannocystis radixulma]
MSAFVVSLREPGHGHPVAVDTIDDVTVATLADAWGDWGGRAAEAPALSGAHTSLLAAARAGETDWPAALVRAFAVAAERVGHLPAPQVDDELWDPITSLVCAVVTPAGISVGWVGGVAACVLADGEPVRETAPHTLIRQLREQGHDLAAFAGSALAQLDHIVVRVVQPAHRGASAPELVAWPPLDRGHKLVLAPARTLAALRAALPAEVTGGEPWLRAVVAACPEPGHRIGALIEP